MLRKKWVLTFLGALIGGVLGYLYWKFVGCADGSCAITSSPINSSLYGILMGGLLFNTIEDYVVPKTNKVTETNEYSSKENN